MNMTTIVTILTTVAKSDDAAVLADKLIRNQLAACIQEIGIRSHYNWENKTQNEPEVLMLIKTTESLKDEVIDFIKSNHTYDLPEIIVLPVLGGLTEYLAWVNSETKRC